MARVTVRVIAGGMRQLNASTVGEVKGLLGLHNYNAFIRGESATDDQGVRDNDNIALAPPSLKRPTHFLEVERFIRENATLAQRIMLRNQLSILIEEGNPSDAFEMAHAEVVLHIRNIKDRKRLLAITERIAEIGEAIAQQHVHLDLREESGEDVDKEIDRDIAENNR